LLDSEAEIRANASISSLLTYNISYTQPLKRFITGGIWNGNGLANIALNLIGFAGLTVSNLIIKDPLQKGIYAGSDGVSGGSSFELYAHDLAFINTLGYSINPSVIGIDQNTSDCNFDMITMKDFTTGLQVRQGGNHFKKIHPWISQSDRLPNTVCINNQATPNFYNNCAFDTYMTGLLTDHTVNLTNCFFEFTTSYRSGLSSNPAFINVTSASAFVIVDGGFLQFTGSTSGQNVDVAIGQTANVFLSNCTYGTPNTNLTSQLPIATPTPLKRIRLQAYTNPTVPANGYITRTWYITDPSINLGVGDSVIFNTRNGTFENGLIPVWGIPAANEVRLILYNTTASPITPADRIVYATDVSNLTDYTPQSVSVGN
jgi:hypothetical protein